MFMMGEGGPLNTVLAASEPFDIIHEFVDGRAGGPREITGFGFSYPLLVLMAELGKGRECLQIVGLKCEQEAGLEPLQRPQDLGYLVLLKGPCERLTKSLNGTRGAKFGCKTLQQPLELF